MTLSNIVSLLMAMGFAGIIGAYFQSRFQRSSQIGQQEHELKRRRYETILILLLTKLDPETGLTHISEFRDDLKSLSDVDKEIETELLHAVLFASDTVINSMSEFVKTPCHKSYVRVAIAMRKDLWNKKTSVGEEFLDIFRTESKK